MSLLPGMLLISHHCPETFHIWKRTLWVICMFEPEQQKSIRGTSMKLRHKCGTSTKYFIWIKFHHDLDCKSEYFSRSYVYHKASQRWYSFMCYTFSSVIAPFLLGVCYDDCMGVYVRCARERSFSLTDRYTLLWIGLHVCSVERLNISLLAISSQHQNKTI